jgi:hypothetical protein
MVIQRPGRVQEVQMVNEIGARDTGRLATSIGAVAIGSAVSLATYFAVGGPFGTINDIGNATIGVLSAGLAWRLRRQIPGRLADVAAGAALVGAAVATVGSALVVSGTTGWFLAGLVSSVGFAGIGAWLACLCLRGDVAPATPRGLRALGIAAGSLMVLGLTAAPGIPLRLDDASTAPAWAWIGSAGWLGIYVVYPAWAIGFGVRLLRHVGQGAVQVAGRSPSGAS